MVNKDTKKLELDALGLFIELRDSYLCKEDRLSVYCVSPCPLLLEYDELWKMYNLRIIRNLEMLRRHIASLAAWKDIISGYRDNQNLLNGLIFDYINPLFSELIDLPQSICNQINQGVFKLNLLNEYPMANWEDMRKKSNSIKNNIHVQAKKTAIQCKEWEELERSLDELHNNENALLLQKYHGNKYHDIIAQPFEDSAEPFQYRDQIGAYAFGFNNNSIDINNLIDAAKSQLKIAHLAYTCFYEYAVKLQKVCLERFNIS